jgi:hypothetical protein
MPKFHFFNLDITTTGVRKTFSYSCYSIISSENDLTQSTALELVEESCQEHQAQVAHQELELH